MKNKTILNVDNLSVRIKTPRGTVSAVNGVSFTLRPGKVLGLVGESGCGKTVTCLSLTGLLNATNYNVSGKVELKGNKITGKSQDEIRSLLGRDMAVIMQSPMSAFNPLLTIRQHFEETIISHTTMVKRQAWELAGESLRQVGLSHLVMNQYPFQLSGGMLQRVMIAIAISMEPAVLIADEPTTSLDATVQKQIIGQLARIQEDFNTGILLVSHDLGVIAQLADEVAVMYCGYIVELAPVLELYNDPAHPYTRALMASRPGLKRKRLRPVGGQPPSLINLKDKGCPFFDRCADVSHICLEYDMDPVAYSESHMVRCAMHLTRQRAMFNELA